ncbi:MAG: hypothetical protein Q8888_02380 [Vigna little leaf phytoplasma]|nr:hypothetical protein [Vigna little leaf phytoplasma]
MAKNQKKSNIIVVPARKKKISKKNQIIYTAVQPQENLLQKIGKLSLKTFLYLLPLLLILSLLYFAVYRFFPQVLADMGQSIAKGGRYCVSFLRQLFTKTQEKFQELGVKKPLAAVLGFIVSIIFLGLVSLAAWFIPVIGPLVSLVGCAMTLGYLVINLLPPKLLPGPTLMDPQTEVIQDTNQTENQTSVPENQNQTKEKVVNLQSTKK